MKPGLPYFAADSTIADISAGGMNRLVQSVEDAHRQIARLETLLNSRRDDGVIHRRGTPVVIVETPTALSKTLRVRKVRYKQNPPQPCVGTNGTTTCQIEWSSNTFDAFPEWGRTIESYAPWAATAPIDPAGGYPFDDKTVFLWAQSVERQWVVEPKSEGGTSVTPWILTGKVAVTPPLISEFFFARPPKFSGTPGQTGPLWIADPDPATQKVVRCWHNHDARHYESMIGLTPKLVVWTVNLKGTETLLPNGAELRMFLTTPTATYAQSDCPVT